MVEPDLSPAVECVELVHLAPLATVRTHTWRQHTAETAVCRATDPLHMTHVVSDSGWEQMRWERLQALAAEWQTQTIDTTAMTRRGVADAVLDWCRSALTGDAPTLRVIS
jgi:hypothetical protein